MRLTVLEFAERYRIKEADASKLLRRAGLEGRLEVSYDDSYKATYIGISTRFDQLAGEYRENASRCRASHSWRGFTPRVGHITSPGKGDFLMGEQDGHHHCARSSRPPWAVKAHNLRPGL